MAYVTERLKSGRLYADLLEIELDTCTNTYGNAPCTANLPAGQECFNTFKTCQDKPNFVKGTKPVWFMSNHAETPIGQNFYPSIEKVQITPAKLDRSKTLGTRAKITITLKDHPHHDRGLDPYLNDRGLHPNLPADYDPMSTGTFWGRLLARNTYENRIANVYTGYLNDPFDINNFEKRTFIVDRVNGPDRRGKITLVLKDILKLANDGRAQAPNPTMGELASDMTDIDTTFDIDDPTDYSAGVRYIRISKEIMEVSLTGSTFTVLERGAFNSDIEEHSAEDNVQECLFFDNQNIVDIIEDLLTTYTIIDPAFIPSAEWAAIKTGSFSAANVTTLLTKPQGVTSLLSEIMEQFQCWMVWDERNQKILFNSNTRLIDCDAPVQTFVFDPERHIIENSVMIKRLVQDRVTQAHVYYAQRDFTVDLKEESNFDRLNVVVNTDSESDNSYGDVKRVVIYSRWFGFLNQNLVNSLASQLVNRKASAPVEVTWQMDAKDTDLWTGDYCQVKALEQQDEFGNIFSPQMQIVSVREIKPDVYEFVAEGDTGVSSNARYGRIAPATQVDYPAATDLEKCKYAFVGQVDSPAFPSDGGSWYLIR